MSVEARLTELGIELPQPMNTSALPFDLVRADGDHLYLSGHVPTDLTGAISKPFGKGTFTAGSRSVNGDNHKLTPVIEAPRSDIWAAKSGKLVSMVAHPETVIGCAATIPSVKNDMPIR